MYRVNIVDGDDIQSAPQLTELDERLDMRAETASSGTDDADSQPLVRVNGACRSGRGHHGERRSSRCGGCRGLEESTARYIVVLCHDGLLAVEVAKLRVS